MLGDEFSDCQCGHGLAGFEGVRYQKGFGLLSSLFSKELPYLKSFGSYIGKHLLNLGSNVVTDVIKEGKPIKESAKRRFKQTASSVATDSMNKLQTLLQDGNGRKKRQTGFGKRRKTSKKIIKKKSCPKKKTKGKKKSCRKTKRINNKRAKTSSVKTSYSFLA